MKKKLTAFKELDNVAKIKDTEDRTAALRQLLADNPSLAKVVQYTYHPEVKWDLPEGDLPETIVTKSEHDDYAPFYQAIKKFHVFRDNVVMLKHNREAQFISVYESVAREDIPLLLGIKDKKLPWRNLGATFVMNAVPELFPPVEKKED